MNNEKLKKMLHAAEKYGADAVCEMVAEHTATIMRPKSQI